MNARRKNLTALAPAERAAAERTAIGGYRRRARDASLEVAHVDNPSP
jgi:hypothetical protein